MKTQKVFPTTAVLGLYTGRPLSNAGFHPVHVCADHLCPGISAIALAFFAEAIRAEILHQHPGLALLPPCTQENWGAWIRTRLKELGPTMVLEGPM